MADVVINFKGSAPGYSVVVDGVRRGLNQVSQAASQMNHSTVTGTQATSAAIRTAFGGDSIRAVEQFIARTLGLGNAMQALFPIIGGLALGKFLVDGEQKVAEFIQKINGIPEALRTGFASINGASQTANDELQKHIDDTQRQIDKLLKKPDTNGLAEALHDAQDMADKLATSILNDVKSVNELLKQNQIGILGQLFTGKSTTGPSNDFITDRNKQYQQFAFRLSEASFNGDQGGIDSAKADLQKFLTDTIAAAKTQLGNSQDEKFNVAIPVAGFGSTVVAPVQATTNQSANRENLQGYVRDLENRLRNVSLIGQAGAADSNLHNVQNQVEQQRDAAEAARKLAEQIKSLQEASDKNFDTILDARKQPELIQPNVQGFFGQNANQAPGVTGYEVPDLTKDTRELAEQARVQTENIEVARQLRLAIEQAGNAFAEQAIQIAVANGTMTAYQAATATAALHTQEYQTELAKLQDQLDKARATGDVFQISASQLAVDNLNANRKTQVAADNQGIQANTAVGGFTTALNQFVTASQDAAGQMRNLVTNTLNSLNQDIVSGKGFTQTGSDLFHSISSTLLQRAEGSVLSAFGFGSAKADGSQSSPFYVRLADGSLLSNGGNPASILNNLHIPGVPEFSGSSSSTGGLIGSLFGKLFGGGSSASGAASDTFDFDSVLGFANGGSPLPDHPIITSEKGPELWIPPPNGRGTIVPNNQLSSIGGTTNHLYVDARGSQDEGAVTAAVHRAMRQYAPGLISASVGAVQDRQNRRPLSAR